MNLQSTICTVATGLLSATLSAMPSFAGGLEVGVSSEAILFQPGRYAEFNYANARPSVDGVLGPTVIPNIGGNLTFLQGGIKTGIGKRLDLALQVREPIQLNVAYPINPALGPLSGLTAELDAVSLRLLARYRINRAFSIIGGLRYQSAAGEFFFGPGRTTLERDGAFGFTAGAAYEDAQKGFRATLIYQSEINHKNETTSALAGRTVVTQSTPRSIALSARARIAPRTFAFGRIHWSDSDSANLSIDNSITGNIARSDFRDTWRFDLGFGKRISKKLTMNISGSWQNGNGEPAGNIFPTNGRTSLEVGARIHVNPKLELTGSIGYSWIGDATAVSGARFEDNNSLLYRSGVAIRF
ncbi:MAG: hypothetical protein AAF423_09035 [Pseudomonadota bacterium]